MDHSVGQPLHDEINLVRLVRRLDKSTMDQGWDDSHPDNWIQAQGTLQKVKHARKLLKNVDTYDADPSPKKTQRYNEIRMTLDRIEVFAKEVEMRTTPKYTRPEPILPTIPLPLSSALDAGSLSSGIIESANSSTSSLHSGEPPTEDLLLLPSDTPSLTSTFSTSAPVLIPSLLSPPSAKSTAITTGAAPRFLQNSSALQQELSDQLANMATQLKRNAMHFSESLAKDQAVVEETQGKLEGNFDYMQKERIRLRDHRGKSTSTTCLVILIVMTVVLLFALMVSIIRFT